MSIFNRVLYAVIGALFVGLLLSGFRNFQLHSEVKVLTTENISLQAANASLTDALKDATIKAEKANKSNIKQSAARAKAGSAVTQSIQETRDARANEVPVTLSPVQLDGLRNLVNKANSTISAASDSK